MRSVDERACISTTIGTASPLALLRTCGWQEQAAMRTSSRTTWHFTPRTKVPLRVDVELTTLSPPGRPVDQKEADVQSWCDAHDLITVTCLTDERHVTEADAALAEVRRLLASLVALDRVKTDEIERMRNRVRTYGRTY